MIEQASGLAFAVAIAETAAEEAAGVVPLGPRRALLFSRPGPVSLEQTAWPLLLAWLMPSTEADSFHVVATDTAQPGSWGHGARREPSSRLLEIPAAWGLTFRPGELVRLYAVPGNVRTQGSSARA